METAKALEKFNVKLLVEEKKKCFEFFFKSDGNYDDLFNASCCFPEGYELRDAYKNWELKTLKEQMSAMVKQSMDLVAFAVFGISKILEYSVNAVKTDDLSEMPSIEEMVAFQEKYNCFVKVITHKSIVDGVELFEGTIKFMDEDEETCFKSIHFSEATTDDLEKLSSFVNDFYGDYGNDD